jgi:DNA-binding NarL/FixJ family response regulator
MGASAAASRRHRRVRLTCASVAGLVPPPRESSQQRRPPSLLTSAEWRRVVRTLQLSPRELEIVKAVTNDLKDSVIAEKLHVTIRTVRTHFERLYRKLGLRSRTGLLLALFRVVRRKKVR